MPDDFTQDGVSEPICNVLVELNFNVGKHWAQQLGAKLPKHSQAYLDQDSAISPRRFEGKPLIIVETKTAGRWKRNCGFEKSDARRGLQDRRDYTRPLVGGADLAPQIFDVVSEN